jgi:hypothetical protein
MFGCQASASLQRLVYLVSFCSYWKYILAVRLLSTIIVAMQKDFASSATIATFAEGACSNSKYPDDKP